MKWWVALLWISGVLSVNILVDPNGNDSPNCGTSNPCKTIGFAVSTASSGDVIQLGAGNYNDQNDLNLSINLSNITIESVNGPDAVVISLGGSTNNFISSLHCNLFSLFGVTLENMGNSAINIIQSQSVSILNCKFMNSRINNTSPLAINNNSPGSLYIENSQFISLATLTGHSAVAIFSLGQLTIQNANFYNISSNLDLGPGFNRLPVIYSVGLTSISDSSFTNNSNWRAVYVNNSVVIENSLFEASNGLEVTGGNLTVLNSTFISNSQSIGTSNGGAIFVQFSNTTISPQAINITSSNFVDNSALSSIGPAFGGAISVASNSSTTAVSISSSTFASNYAIGASVTGPTGITAPGLGGSISVTGGGSLSIISCNFTGNYATGGNGAFTIAEGPIRNNIDFRIPSGAAGGAIFCQEAALSLYSSQFVSNQLNGGSLVGFSPEHFDKKDFLGLFDAYLATGTAIYTSTPSSDTTNIISNCTFSGNSIYSDHSSFLHVEGGVIYSNAFLTISQSEFQSNTVNGFSLEGGIIRCQSANISDTNFTSNLSNGTSSVTGGIILSLADTTLQGNFIENTAQGETVVKGGSVCMLGGNGSVQNSTFNNNRVNGSQIMGGVIYTEASTTVKDTYFTHTQNFCKVLGYGGALAISTASTNYNGSIENCEFIDNFICPTSELSNGGALWANFINPSSISIMNTNFIHNMANYGGGCSISTESLFENVVFTDNNATTAGGAMYISKNFANALLIETCNDQHQNQAKFENNSAAVGQNCASKFSALATPLHRTESTVVFPYQPITITIEVRDHFGRL